MLIDGTTLEDNRVSYGRALVGYGHYVDVSLLEPESYTVSKKLDPSTDIRSYVLREHGSGGDPDVWEHTQGVNFPVERTPAVMAALVELCITRPELINLNDEWIDNLIGKLEELRRV